VLAAGLHRCGGQVTKSYSLSTGGAHSEFRESGFIPVIQCLFCTTKRSRRGTAPYSADAILPNYKMEHTPIDSDVLIHGTSCVVVVILSQEQISTTLATEGSYKSRPTGRIAVAITLLRFRFLRPQLASIYTKP
jgi:hypothetical protein